MTAKMVALLTLALATTGAAADPSAVARWVDDDGVTHFADRQFAPPDADAVEVEEANGMDAPATSGAGRSASGPQWTKLALPSKKNRKGWRSRSDSPYAGRKQRSGRR